MSPSYPSLPSLDDDALAEQFGDDPDAIRRYRVLFAVLVQGTAQRDVAAAYQVSERTIRNTLRAYRSGGLEALCSRRLAPRRAPSRRLELFEDALTTALAEDVGAGGDRLWRRAQVLLGDDGERLSRRTAYRILRRLRNRSTTSAIRSSLLGTLRTALPLLLEDPPLSLGAGPLAQRLLPAESDQLLRGTLVQQALRAALDRLRPSGSVSVIDRSWWPYLICTGEYEAGQSRAELQRDLALSASTYSRAKRQGLEQIATVLPRIIAPMIAAPTTLASQRLPRTPDFVGRREEQSYYAWRLQTDGYAYIWGLPGSGKTALAAELSAEGRRYGQTILWHTCRLGPDATALGILSGLAQALAGEGDERLWRAMRQQPADERDPLALIDLLRDCLLDRPAVVVLDDAHRATSSETAALLAMLRALVERRSVRLLLIGRSSPEEQGWQPLRGLNERDARMLWAGLPALPAEQWRALYAASSGLPQPLRLAAGAHRRAGDLARPDGWKEEVIGWARDELWERAGGQEQDLLAATLALEGCEWAAQTELVLELLGVDVRVWERVQRFGLIERDGERATLHPVLRACAEARLREDGTLREQLDEIAATVAGDLPGRHEREAQVGAPIREMRAPVVLESVLPAGLELLARVRAALSDSAALLQHSDDRVAVQLAAELATLHAALPELV